MVNKPEDHIEFIMDSLARVSLILILIKILFFLQYKDSKQPLKWDAFVGSKGLKNNTLATIKKKTINMPPPFSFLTEVNHQPKLESIPQSKLQASSSTNQDKELLKGKPIIFVGGGPGRKRISFKQEFYFYPIGSGKGTQCEKMIEKYGFTHLSAGDLIREAAQDSKSEKGRYFNEMMSQGKLISTVIKSHLFTTKSIISLFFFYL